MIVIRSYGLVISVKFGYYVSAKTLLEAMKFKKKRRTKMQVYVDYTAKQ